MYTNKHQPTADASDVANHAVASYARRHYPQAVALPELINEIADAANTSTTIAKRAVFRAIDRGEASFTPDFKVVFVFVQ